MMFEGGGSDVEAGGKSRKENRRETWAPGLGMSSLVRCSGVLNRMLSQAACLGGSLLDPEGVVEIIAT